MIKLYLITGFLGAGKTTTLKNLIINWKEQRLAVIVNEFGKEGIDGQLIKNTGILTEEITNGSIFCSCKLDKFIEVLQDVVKKKPECIIVEASGLADPTHIKRILEATQLKEELEFMGSMCLIDAQNFHRVIKTANVSRRQVKISELAIINKVDLVDQERISRLEKELKEINPYLRIYHTSYGELKEEWFDNLQDQTLQEREKEIQIRDIGLQKFLVKIKGEITYKECMSFLEMFIEDTYRIKGFVRLDEKMYLLDCVGLDINMSLYEEKVENENQLVILAGAQMPTEKSLKKASEWYCRCNIEIQA